LPTATPLLAVASTNAAVPGPKFRLLPIATELAPSADVFAPTAVLKPPVAAELLPTAVLAVLSPLAIAPVPSATLALFAPLPRAESRLRGLRCRCRWRR
jgi:hypothetical protein